VLLFRCSHLSLFRLVTFALLVQHRKVSCKFVYYVVSRVYLKETLDWQVMIDGHARNFFGEGEVVPSSVFIVL
jgi:hypothetical protein